MAPVSHYIESLLGRLFWFVTQHDSQLVSRTCPSLTKHQATLSLTSSELGETSPGHFTAGKHELLGQNLFPALSWDASATLPEAQTVKSWLLIVEDADAPLPSPSVHGIFYDIPRTKTTLSSEDFVESNHSEGGMLQGGFRFGKNRRGTVWTGPRPVLSHGNHRYFFTLVGLDTEELQGLDQSKPVDKEALVTSDGPLTDKVLCWGEYIADFKRDL